MTIFTWTWVNDVQADQIRRAPQLIPTNKKTAITYAVKNLYESRSKICLACSPGKNTVAHISAVYTPLQNLI